MGNTPIITDELELTGQEVEQIIVAWTKAKYPQYATATMAVSGIMARVKITAQYRDDKEAQIE